VTSCTPAHPPRKATNAGNNHTVRRRGLLTVVSASVSAA
jgi:hypothetical protein